MWFRLFGLMLWMFHVAAQTPEGEFTVVSDIQYCTGGGRPLLMDVFVPKHRNRTPTAAVLWIHGGGWERGDKNGNSGWQKVSSKVQAASAYYGVSDFTVGAMQFQHRTGKVVVKLFRGTEKDKPDLYRKASPVFYVSKDDPPLLLAHGEQDELVPFDQSVRMADAYHRIGLPVKFIAVKNAGHDFEHVGDGPVSPSLETIHQETVDFFKRFLLHQPGSPPRLHDSAQGGPDRGLWPRVGLQDTSVNSWIQW